jgi:hypothetical protein
MQVRRDMAKVIVERPRHGSRLRGARKGYRKRFHKIALEDQPKRERIEERGGGMKNFNEHLGPLRRYLLGQVDRPWNKVYSEICTNLSRDSVVQDHVRDHVWDYVEVNVKLKNGQPCYASGRLCDQPLNTYWWGRFPILYVCPKSGLLRRVKPPRGRRRPNQPPNLRDSGRLTLVPFDADNVFALVNRAWHFVEFAPFPRRCQKRDPGGVFAAPTATDAIFDRIVREDAIRHYGRAVYATRARRATTAEVRRYCTKGGVPDIV